jgi:hypothetical protein
MEMPQKNDIFNKRSMLYALVVLLIITVGLYRIFSTYSVYWQTWDEPFHIAAGMEWLDKRQYTYEPFHPPFARIMAALLPYVDGLRGIEWVSTWDEAWQEGNSILHSGGGYDRNLTLARLGILPFFVAASLIVTLWSKKISTAPASIIALFLFTTLPPILGHAGLATLDMASTAMVAFSLFAFTIWLQQPTLNRTFIFGVATGLAILTKFSAIAFVFAGAISIAVLFTCHSGFKAVNNERKARNRFGGNRVLMLLVALVISAVTIWGGYRFSIQLPLKDSNTINHSAAAPVPGGEPVKGLMSLALQHIPLPAPEFLDGLAGFLYRNKVGHPAYMFGTIKDYGRWFYFPVMLLVKTPLPFILLTVCGLLIISVNPQNCCRNRNLILLPVVAAAGILLIAMTGKVNNGVRQILCVYPLGSIVAGYGAAAMLTLKGKFRCVGIVIVSILLSWQLFVSYETHPDYLAYFNYLAQGRTEEFGVDSDLDWGQDLKRLTTIIKRRNIDRITIMYNGSRVINLQNFNFPEYRLLEPYQSATGWVAISLYNLKLGTEQAPYDQFSWLNEFIPVEKVGSSILLYYIPEK